MTEIKEMKHIGRRWREASRDVVEAELPDRLRTLLQNLSRTEGDTSHEREGLERCERIR